MKYRLLGKTGLKVSEIGFGTWGLGGTTRGSVAYGRTDDKESIGSLRKAFELGVNFYDTAALYGYGHSEKLLGKTFKRLRHKIILASKVGFVDFHGKQNFSPRYLRQSLKKSLIRLQTDYLDLYQLHSPPLLQIENDPSIFRIMNEFKQKGLIRAIGVSVQSPEDGLRLIRKFKIDCLQVNFNLTDQRAKENGLFDECKKQNIGIIVRTPLCFGLLIQTPLNKFLSGDHRERFSSKQISRWTQAYPLFEKQFPSGRSSSVQNALRFCLSFPVVSTVIPGMLTIEHVEENIPASSLSRLQKRHLKGIYRIYKTHSFFKKNQN